jgi:hypothetical protein
MGFNKDTDAVVAFASSVVDNDNVEVNGIIIGNTTAIFGVFRQLLKDEDMQILFKTAIESLQNEKE